MIGVLTHHWAKPDKVDEAKKLLDGNGTAQRAPGFVSRQTLYSSAIPPRSPRWWSGTATTSTISGAPVQNALWP